MPPGRVAALVVTLAIPTALCPWDLCPWDAGICQAQSKALELLSRSGDKLPIQFELPQLRKESPAEPAEEDVPNCATESQLAASLKSMRSIQLNARPETGGLPLPQDCFDQDQRLAEGETQPSSAAEAGSRPPYHLYWAASGLVHYPTYFRDVGLERYGIGSSSLCQPFISGGRFYKDIFILPYKVGLDHPYQKIYDLGLKRPGNPAHAVTEHLPWSKRAALYQAGAIATGALLLP